MRKKYLNALLFGALVVASTGTFTSCKDYDDDIDKVQEGVNKNAAELNKLGEQVAASKEATATELAAAKAELAKLSEGKADKTAVEELTKKITELSGKGGGITEAELKAEVSKIFKVTDASADPIEAAASKLADLTAKAAKIDELQTKINKLADSQVDIAKLAELKKEVYAVIGGRLTSMVFKPSAYVGGIETLDLNSLSYLEWGNKPEDWLNDESKLLERLFVTPEVLKVVTGKVENQDKSINVETLVSALKADYKGLLNTVMTNETTDAVFNVSPSIVDVKSIGKLYFTDGLATTRVADKKALLEVVGDPTISDGEMTVKVARNLTYNANSGAAYLTDKLVELQTAQAALVSKANALNAEETTLKGKTDQASVNRTKAINEELKGLKTEIFNNSLLVEELQGALGSDESKINISALCATIAENALTAQEKDKKLTPVVYSNYFRLAEKTITPELVANNKVAEKLELQNFSAIYTKSKQAASESEINSKCTTNVDMVTKAIYNKGQLPEAAIISLPYDATDLNLKKYVTVKAGKTDIKDIDSKFAFEFYTVDYNVIEDTKKHEATNEAKFAELSKDGNIVATSLDGTKNNRSAVGRTPVIQVVLRDKKNNKVVDVNYFAVKWVANANANIQKDVTKHEFDASTICGKEFKVVVNTEDMNKVYAKMNDGKGMARDEFFNTYKLVENPYAYNKDNVLVESTKLGTLEISNFEVNGASGTTTQNVVWKLADDALKFNEAEYKAKKATRTIYAKFAPKATDDVTPALFLELTAVFNIEPIALVNDAKNGHAAGINTTNLANDVMTVRTSLPTDQANNSKSAFITNVLKNGFTYVEVDKDGKKKAADPANVAALINTDQGKFVFNKAEIKKWAKANNKSWTVSEDGQTLNLGNEVAAKFEGGEFKLGTDGLTPTASAKLLLGMQVPVILQGENNCMFTKVNNKDVVLTVPVKSFNLDVQKILEASLLQVKNPVQDAYAKEQTIDVASLIKVSEAHHYSTKNNEENLVLIPAPVTPVDPGTDASAAEKAQYAKAKAAYDAQVKYINDMKTFYGVEVKPVNKDEVTVNLAYDKSNNLVVGEKFNKVSEFKNLTVTVEGTTLKVTYANNASKIAKPYTIKVPVTVASTWQEFKLEVLIPVEPQK